MVRHRVRLTALAGLALCAAIADPFLPALAWALALAVIAFPVHARLKRRLPGANWAAGLSTALVVAVILAPVLLVADQLGREAAAARWGRWPGRGGSRRRSPRSRTARRRWPGSGRTSTRG